MVGAALLIELDRLLAVSGQLGMDTAGLQDLHDDLGVEGVVLGDQDVFAVEHPALDRRIAAALVADLVRCRQVVFQGDDEGRPAAQLAVAGDGPAQEVDQVSADIQAQAGAVPEIHLIGDLLLKGHEHLFLEGIADPPPGIPDGIGVAGVRIRVEDADLEVHPSSRSGEFDRVAQEVDDDAGHMLRVHHDDPVLAAVDPGLQGQAGRPRLLGHDGDRLLDDLPLPYGGGDADHLAGIDPAGLQHLVDQAGQIVGR